jgi:hypothetical protein
MAGFLWDNILQDLMDVKKKYSWKEKKKKRRRGNSSVWGSDDVTDLMKQSASFALCPFSGWSKFRCAFNEIFQSLVDL